MVSGLDATFHILSTTKNEAALPWLIAVFQQGDSSLKTLALQGLLERRDPGGYREIVRAWQQLDASQQQIVEALGTRLTGAVREGILSPEPELNRNSCEMVVRLREYDLIPTLVKAAEDKSNLFAEQAAQAAVELAEFLSNELNAPRDYRSRRDPALIRQFVYNSLEHSVRHFSEHRRAALTEAYLLLVHKGDSLLRQILDTPDDPAYTPIVRHLMTSNRLGVIRVILEAVDELHAPPAVMHVLTRRRDPVFLRALFTSRSKKISPNLRCNLRKVDTWSWLRDDLSALMDLSDEELSGAVLLATTSGLNRLRAFEVVQFALQAGGELSRRTACASLLEFKGGEANELVLQALTDTDPEVQAIAVKQLRERGIPGAVQRLIELLDTPHDLVRDAVYEALSEFTFQRYVSAFESLDKDARKVSGALVKRVDRDAIGQLQVELTSLSRSRRLRGIEVAIAMNATREVEEELVMLSEDTDHFVRVASIPALVLIGSPLARRRLEDMRFDRAASVQEAVEQVLDAKPVYIPDPFAAGPGAPGTPAF